MAVISQEPSAVGAQTAAVPLGLTSWRPNCGNAHPGGLTVTGGRVRHPATTTYWR
ncbi:hypothetical protein MXD62_15035 [Frankia sp. Mgl5]|uniref:hypothetical protein n=1 Tax=Frankia sp. Mgl5 TaxID=2933793 RepID=UPI00200FFA5A|nr:hypothetical protein [Frankia sp. Mgl5]MCK9928472.1 hypothetical protein [Frankia sp. Mgl5]